MLNRTTRNSSLKSSFLPQEQREAYARLTRTSDARGRWTSLWALEDNDTGAIIACGGATQQKDRATGQNTMLHAWKITPTGIREGPDRDHLMEQAENTRFLELKLMAHRVFDELRASDPINDPFPSE